MKKLKLFTAKKLYDLRDFIASHSTLPASHSTTKALHTSSSGSPFPSITQHAKGGRSIHHHRYLHLTVATSDDY
jgi:hypothetical protein